MSHQPHDETRGASAPGCSILDDESVGFSYRDETAGEVLVAGDFSGWARSALPMARWADGAFRVTTHGLSPGVHGYKLLVDGRWERDPRNPLHRDNGHGGRNSAFVVGHVPPRKPGVLRVASLNLHTYQEPDPLAKLEDVAFGMAAFEADVLLLQEVAQHVSDPDRPNAGELVRRALESQTGKSWGHHWREAHVGFQVYREGLSVLSHLPLADVSWHTLSPGPLARGALTARVSAGSFELLLASVHTSWDSRADPEIETLLDSLERASRGADAVLVAGDFNGGPRASQVRAMRAAGFLDVGMACGMEEPTFLEPPVERIDYHFLKPTATGKLPRPAAFYRLFDGLHRGFCPRVSDHAGLLGEYEVG